MFTGAHDLLALAEMHLGRRGEDHGVGALDAFGQFAGVMRNAVFLGDLRGRILVAADQRRHFDFGNALERVEMLLPERALSRDADFHYRFSEIKKIAVISARHCERGEAIQLQRLLDCFVASLLAMTISRESARSSPVLRRV